MNRVLILGATGMLGSACFEVLSSSSNFEITGTSRVKNSKYEKFDVKVDSIEDLMIKIKPNWAINCIGVIKPHIHENNEASILNAIDVNSLFPFNLAEVAKKHGVEVIQIATDCVYSGKSGKYQEFELHDATDVYGKTKSLGEVLSKNVIHIRASIIGPEVGRSTSLLEWFRSQPLGVNLDGFTDHLWNGVTTFHFAKIAEGIINASFSEPGKYHLIPGDIVTKAELLRVFAIAYDRSDIQINDTVSKQTIDRTLGTSNPEISKKLWNMAGYETPPSIKEMVEEQAHNNSV